MTDTITRRAPGDYYVLLRRLSFDSDTLRNSMPRVPGHLIRIFSERATSGTYYGFTCSCPTFGPEGNGAGTESERERLVLSHLRKHADISDWY